MIPSLAPGLASSRRLAFAAAAASGLALRLCFPKLDCAPLAWIAIVPLDLALLAGRPLRGFVLGWVSGCVFFGALLAWILGIVAQYSGLPMLLWPLPWLLLVGYLSLYTGLYGLTFSLLARRSPAASLVMAPVFWTGLEWMRGTFLTGFPWGLLGASQQNVTLVAQTVSLAGVYGLTFLIASFSSAVCGLLLSRRAARARWRWCGLATIAAVALVVVFWGVHRLREEQSGCAGAKIEVACIQGNTPLDAISIEGPQILRTHLDLTRQAAAGGARLILWAESCTPYMVEADSGYRETLRKLSRELGASIVVGSVGGPEEGPYANTAYLVRPDGVIPSRYDKRHLVPYGEYVPLARLTPFVPRFVDAIGDFQPGAVPIVWEVEGTRVSPVICYESIFPGLSRGAVRAGAEVLLNLTNDGWFRGGAGAAQHLGLARLRAIETGRPLVRAANTGISAVFDSRGRTLARSGIGTREAIVAAVTPCRDSTPCLLMGEAPPILCAIITTLSLVVTLLLNGRIVLSSERKNVPAPAPPEEPAMGD